MVRFIESKRLGDILELVLLVIVIIIINQLASFKFFRIDLTEEKRFTISEPTKQILSGLEETIYVDVYLDGELPAGFKRLQKSIQETLEEFAIYSDNRIQYQFIDPESAASASSRNEFIISLAEKGIQPTDVFLTENGQRIQKRILPGAIISYRGAEKGVLLLKGNRGAPSEVRLNQSIEGVEYELITGIKSLINEDFDVIGYATGHGEPEGVETTAFRQLVEDRFILREVDIRNVSTIESDIDVLVITQPKSRFSNSEKYKIDQYLMKGGNLMLFVDALDVDMDSVRSGTFSFPFDHDLDDLFFRYGFRINKDLVQDYQSSATPVVVGNFGEEAQVQLLPWPFYPILNNYGSHPIVRNMDAVLMNYVSSIDTVKADGVNKIPLLFSSPYSRVIVAPVRVDVRDLQTPVEPSEYDKRNLPLGYLFEGKFTSLFKNRLLPEGFNQGEFVAEGEGKIIMISDGDFVLNNINPRNNQPQVLGFDLNTGQQYANQDFLVNSFNYLLENDGLIMARNKEVIIRPLDRAKINAERQFWQVLNVVTPVLIVLLFGIIKWYLRKRKYSRIHS